MDNRRGITLMVLAMASFAVEDGFIKVAAMRVPVGQILTVISVPGLLFYGLLMRHQGQPILSRDAFHPMALLRLVGEMAGAVLAVSAIAAIPLATASAILQALPLGITAAAALFLGEPVGWRRWSAVLVGFLGVLMIVRPGAAGFETGAILAILAVAAFVVRDLATARVPHRITSLQLAAWVYIMLIPTGILLDLATGSPWVWPDATNAVALGGAMLFGIFGYWSMIEAMRGGEITLIVPFRYTRLIFTLTIAVIFLGERPDGWTLAGAGVIILTGLYTLDRERRLRRAPSPVATPLRTDPTP